MIKSDLVQDVEVNKKYGSSDIISIYPSTTFGYMWVWYRASDAEELAATDSQHTQLAIAARSLISGYDEGGMHVSLDLLVNNLRTALQQQAGA